VKKRHLLWILPLTYLCVLIFPTLTDKSSDIQISFEKNLLIVLSSITATLVFYVVAKRKTVLPVLFFVTMILATAEVFYLFSSYNCPFTEKLSGEIFAVVTLTIALPYTLAGYVFRRREYDELG